MRFGNNADSAWPIDAAAIDPATAVFGSTAWSFEVHS